MRYVLSILTFLVLIAIPADLKAQVSVNFNLNIQPPWGPVGYDYVEYYYLPDIEVYYHVPMGRYYYFDNGAWIFRTSLPSRYHYDFYNSYKVVVNEKNPWRNHNNYKKKYKSYVGRRDQRFIRDSDDPKYFKNKFHPKYKKMSENKKGKEKFKGEGEKNNKHKRRD